MNFLIVTLAKNYLPDDYNGNFLIASSFQDGLKKFAITDEEFIILIQNKIEQSDIDEIILNYSDDCVLVSKEDKKKTFVDKVARIYLFLATHKKVDYDYKFIVFPIRYKSTVENLYGKEEEFQLNIFLSLLPHLEIKEILTSPHQKNKKEVASFFHLLKSPLTYIFVGVSSTLIDILTFYLFSTFVFVNAKTNNLDLLFATLASRSISLPYNYILLEKVVFHHKKLFHHSFYKYLITAILSIFISYGLTVAFSYIDGPLTIIKFVIDCIIGIVRYFINLMLIFANRKLKKIKN